MSGRSAQAKGRRAEIELANYLQGKGFTDARAGAPLNYGTEPDITGIDGIHIECKRVIYRQNRRPWMIVLSLSDFIELQGGITSNGKQ